MGRADIDLAQGALAHSCHRSISKISDARLSCENRKEPMTQVQFSAMPTDREAVVIGLMLLFLAVWLVFGMAVMVGLITQ
jgi:hypothetical protein